MTHIYHIVSDWISLALKAPAASRPKSVPPAPMGVLVKWEDWMENVCEKTQRCVYRVAVAGSPKHQPANLLFAWVLQVTGNLTRQQCLRFLFGWPFAMKAETTVQSYRSDVSKSKSSVTSLQPDILFLPAACDHCLPLRLQVTRKALHGAYRLALRCQVFSAILSSHHVCEDKA